MLSAISPSSYYTISLLPLKATFRKAVVHTVAKISIPTPCCTSSKEAFTCYFNNIRTTNNLPTARCTGHPQMIVPHLLAFHTDPSHLLKTLIYLTLTTTLFRFPAWLVLPYLFFFPQQVSFSFLSLSFFPSTFNCWNYPELSHQAPCLFNLQMVLNTICVFAW